ncbi:MAG TPA: RNA polymerase sigma-70 factor [Pedobacter sp.]
MGNLHLLDDTELIHYLKKDDEAAFAQIYQRYAESLAGFAASKLYSLEDAQDLIHDLFVKLWADRKELIITSNLKTYLFTIVRYRIVDKIRKNITREEYAGMIQSLAQSYEPGVEQQIAAKELQRNIETSLKELSPKVQQVYHLSREEHLSNREIAQKLGLSEQTVKNQLSTALKHLRQSVIGLSAQAFMLWIS